MVHRLPSRFERTSNQICQNLLFMYVILAIWLTGCMDGWLAAWLAGEHQTIAHSHITRFISGRCMRSELLYLMRNFRIKARILNGKTYQNEHYQRM